MVSCEMSYPFLVKRGFNWDATSPWHDFLEGVQRAAGPEEAQAEAATPVWSNTPARWKTGLDVGSLGCLAAFGRAVKNQNPIYSSPYCSEKPALNQVSYLYHRCSPKPGFPLSSALRG